MNKIDTLLIVKGFGLPDRDRWQDHEEESAMNNPAIRQVVYPRDIPDFQGEARPLVTDFIAFLRDLLQRKSINPEQTLVLAHSLGGDGWVHFVKQMTEFRAAMTRLIAAPKENRTGYESIDDFFPVPDPELTTEQQALWLIIGSDPDPVIHEPPKVMAEHLGKEVRYVTINGATHFMPRTLHGDPDQMDLGKEFPKIRNRFELPY